MLSLNPILHALSQGLLPSDEALNAFTSEANQTLQESIHTPPMLRRKLRILLKDSFYTIFQSYRHQRVPIPDSLSNLASRVDGLKKEIPGPLPEIDVKNAMSQLSLLLPSRRDKAPIEQVRPLHTALYNLRTSIAEYPDADKLVFEAHVIFLYFRYDQTFGNNASTIRSDLVELKRQGKINPTTEQSQLEIDILHWVFLPRGVPPEPPVTCAFIDAMYSAIESRGEFPTPEELKILTTTFLNDWTSLQYHPYPPINVFKTAYRQLASLHGMLQLTIPQGFEDLK